MNRDLFTRIEELARPFYPGNDPAHDFLHIGRVVGNARHIQKKEGGDTDIIAAAAFFHDCVKYHWKDPNKHLATQESADKAEEMLLQTDTFPAHKIPAVKACIIEHSFSAQLMPTSLESAIIQDADRLDATGAFGIMRTCASAGTFSCPLYHETDPFCADRPIDQKNIALDLFYERLFVVAKNMNTKTARKMAKANLKVMDSFLEQVSKELRIPRPKKYKEPFWTFWF